MTLIEIVAKKCRELNLTVDMWKVMKYLCPSDVIDGVSFECPDIATYVDCPRCWTREVNADEVVLCDARTFVSKMNLVFECN